MSWDVYLYDDRGHLEGSWSYTYNTSPMIYQALREVKYDLDNETWGKHLSGKSGPEGGAFLDIIIKELERDPAAYERLNPENGWGNYEGLLDKLREMRDAARLEWPTVWSI